MNRYEIETEKANRMTLSEILSRLQYITKNYKLREKSHRLNIYELHALHKIARVKLTQSQ